jgi:hypothetical protein
MDATDKQEKQPNQPGIVRLERQSDREANNADWDKPAVEKAPDCDDAQGNRDGRRVALAKRISPFASKEQSRKSDAAQASLTAVSQIKKQAKMREAIHNRCAGPHGSIANGATHRNAVGR